MIAFIELNLELIAFLDINKADDNAVHCLKMRELEKFM